MCDVVDGWELRARVWGLAPAVVSKRSRRRLPGGPYWSSLLNFRSLMLLEGGRLYSSTCHVSYVHSIAAAAASTAAAASSSITQQKRQQQHRKLTTMLTCQVEPNDDGDGPQRKAVSAHAVECQSKRRGGGKGRGGTHVFESRRPQR